MGFRHVQVGRLGLHRAIQRKARCLRVQRGKPGACPPWMQYGPVMSPSDPRYGRPAGAPVYSDRGAPMPTGPILSPDDPRYGRTAPAPVYSDRGAATPTGPVLSPDDPRYGRPAGPPAVIYGDRSPGSQQQPAYSDRGAGMGRLAVVRPRSLDRTSESVHAHPAGPTTTPTSRIYSRGNRLVHNSCSKEMP